MGEKWMQTHHVFDNSRRLRVAQPLCDICGLPPADHPDFITVSSPDSQETPMPGTPTTDTTFDNGPRTTGRQQRDRDRILETAARLISGDREASYGDAADGFTRTGKMWAAILGLSEVTPEQVALCMAALKISRLCTTPNHDESWVDGCGYLALGGDIAATPGRYM